MDTQSIPQGGLSCHGLSLIFSKTYPRKHWTITATPGGPTTASAYATSASKQGSPIGGVWLPNTAVSRWISPQADESAGDAPGGYTYRTTVDASQVDPAETWLTVRLAVADQLADVRLNGKGLGLTAKGAAAFTTLSIHEGLVYGMNILEFIVVHEGSVTGPSGLQAELSLLTSPGDASLPALRATARARLSWLDLLQGRADQEQTIMQSLQTAVSATEEAALPPLRDALLATESAVVPGRNVANWLTQRLLIDVRTSGSVLTTRTKQAIETLQSIIFALRTGHLRDEEGAWNPKSQLFMAITRKRNPMRNGSGWDLTSPGQQPCRSSITQKICCFRRCAGT